MKWVFKRPGVYKLVEDDDPRPEVKLKNKKGTPKIHETPPWKKFEKGQTIGTPDQQWDSSEAFDKVRDHAMKTDPKWKRWEDSRKKSMAKDKPAWRKQQRI